jgi:Clp amino terminal domain, pathogenicity island component
MFGRSDSNGHAAADYHPWSTYVDAREEAKRRGDRKVGTEHLVLALLMEPALAAALGTGLQEARSALEAIDREALAAVGLDARLDVPLLPAGEPGHAPRRPTLKAVWQDRLPLTPAAKAVLKESSTGMRRGRQHPGAKYILASLLQLQRPDPAAELFTRLSVDPAAAQERLADV